MLLHIHNLPSNTKYQDIKTLIQEKCGVSEVIVDELKYEGERKKVTVGFMSEDDAAIVVRKINGIYLNGHQLYIEDIRKGKSSDQPYKPPSSSVVSEQQAQYQQVSPFSYSYNNTFVPSMMNQPGSSQMTSSFRTGYVPMPVSMPQIIPMEYNNPGGMLMGPPQMVPPVQKDHEEHFQYDNYRSQNRRQGINSTENRGRNAPEDNNRRNYDSEKQWDMSAQNRKSNWQTSSDNRVFNRAVGPTNDSSKGSWTYENKEWQNNKNTTIDVELDTVKNEQQRSWGYGDLKDNNDVKRPYKSSRDIPRNRDRDDEKTNTRLTHSRDRKRHLSPNPYQQFNDVSYKKQKIWDFQSVEPIRDSGLNKPVHSRNSRYEQFHQNPGPSDFHGDNTYKGKFETHFKFQNDPKNTAFGNPGSIGTGYKVDRKNDYSQVSGGRSEKWVEKKHEPYGNKKPFYPDSAQNWRDESNKWNDTRKVFVAETKTYSLKNQNTAYRGSSQKALGPKKRISPECQKTWIYQAVAEIISQVAENSSEFIEKLVAQKMKLYVKDRMEIVLGKDFGVQPNELIKRYRQKFLKKNDKIYYNKLKRKILAAQKSGTMFSNENQGLKPKETFKKVEIKDKKEEKQNISVKYQTEGPENAVVKRAKIPNYPNKDKSQFKQQKQEARQEFKENSYSLSPEMQKVLDDDLDEIMDLIVKECDNPVLHKNLDEKEYSYIDKKIVECIPDMKSVLKLIVTKRILNICTNLCFRVYGTPKLPKKTLLSEFLINYDVISLKKAVKNKMFIGRCNSYENYDKLLSLERVIGGNTVTFKPLQLIGPPDKSKRNKTNKDQTSDVNVENIEKNAVDNKETIVKVGGSNETKTTNDQKDIKEEMNIQRKDKIIVRIVVEPEESVEDVKKNKETIEIKPVIESDVMKSDENENDVNDEINKEFDLDDINEEDLEDY